MRLKRGLVQVYIGEGKGKTTASIGQAIRALGHNFKVCLVSFFKNPSDFEYGEVKILKDLGVKIYNFAPKHPHFYKDISFKEVRKECLKGLEFIKNIFKKQPFDMLILDEINIALRDGYLKQEEVMGLLHQKPEGLELILTGRGATKEVIARADLVSEIRKVRHPLERGIEKRKGIEY